MANSSIVAAELSSNALGVERRGFSSDAGTSTADSSNDTFEVEGRVSASDACAIESVSDEF